MQSFWKPLQRVGYKQTSSQHFLHQLLEIGCSMSEIPPPQPPSKAAFVGNGRLVPSSLCRSHSRRKKSHLVSSPLAWLHPLNHQVVHCDSCLLARWKSADLGDHCQRAWRRILITSARRSTPRLPDKRQKVTKATEKLEKLAGKGRVGGSFVSLGGGGERGSPESCGTDLGVLQSKNSSLQVNEGETLKVFSFSPGLRLGSSTSPL